MTNKEKLLREILECQDLEYLPANLGILIKSPRMDDHARMEKLVKYIYNLGFNVQFGTNWIMFDGKDLSYNDLIAIRDE